MSRPVKIEFCCHECGHTDYLEHKEYECPKCGSERVGNFAMIECYCGETVPADDFTNICPECGRMYNAFGQELAPVSQWDPDDEYDTFGPQNEED